MSKKILFSIILFSIVCFLNCDNVEAVSVNPKYQIKSSSHYYDNLNKIYRDGEIPQYEPFFVPYFFIPKNSDEPITADYVPGEEDTFITPEYAKAHNVKWYIDVDLGAAEIDSDGYITITSFQNDPGMSEYWHGCALDVHCEMEDESGSLMISENVRVVFTYYLYYSQTKSSTSSAITESTQKTADVTIADPIPAPVNKLGATVKTKTTYTIINTIEPPTLSLSLKKLAKNKVKLTWKSKSGTSLKKRNDLAGYQIKYWWKKSKKTSKKYTRKIKKYSKITTTFKKLKKNRKYYFKVRAYKKRVTDTTFDINCGKWSKTKTVKIKK